MPDVLYVGLQDDDKIVSFGIDTVGRRPAAVLAVPLGR
jgi:hypothetical protein